MLLVLALATETTSKAPVKRIPLKSPLQLQKNPHIHNVNFYDKKSFIDGTVYAQSHYTKKDYSIKGGIVPHHLLPGFIIADFFHHLSVQNPKTVIVIGPNHYELGNFKILTSLYAWKTPFGIVQPNIPLTQELINQNVLKVDENVLPRDHSVSAMMPFMKYYLPKAHVVPILVSGKLTQDESRIFSQQLHSILDENTVVIATVDFSHYLSKAEATEKDLMTKKVLRSFDYNRLYALNNDYLDSPPSIGILLMLMQKEHATHSDILFNTNSGEIEHENFSPTTSYFSILYY